MKAVVECFKERFFQEVLLGATATQEFLQRFSNNPARVSYSFSKMLPFLSGLIQKSHTEIPQYIFLEIPSWIIPRISSRAPPITSSENSIWGIRNLFNSLWNSFKESLRELSSESFRYWFRNTSRISFKTQEFLRNPLRNSSKKCFSLYRNFFRK